MNLEYIDQPYVSDLINGPNIKNAKDYTFRTTNMINMWEKTLLT